MDIIAIILSVVSMFGTAICFILAKVFKLGETNKKIEFMEKDVNSLIADVRNMREDMARVQTILIMKHKNAEDVFSVKHSPRILSALGEEMYKKMEGEQFLLANREFLFGKIDERKPQTALDVESTCQWVCSSNVNETFFNPIKTFVYNCPMVKIDEENEIEFTLSSACFVLGLRLRDLYLAEHPELK